MPKPYMTIGAASADSLEHQVREHGGTREDAIARYLRDSIRTYRRTRPDVPLSRIVVDLTDHGRTVKWCLHTGEHVPSAFDADRTKRYPAMIYLAD